MSNEVFEGQDRLLQAQEIGAALHTLRKQRLFGRCATGRGFPTDPPQTPWGEATLSLGEGRGGRYGDFGWTSLLPWLGPPLGEIAAQIMVGAAKSLDTDSFPQDMGILLSGFPLGA